MRRFVVHLAMVVGSLFTASGIAFAQLNDEVPKEVQGVGVDQNLGNNLPMEVAVVDSSGRQVRLGQLFEGERPVLVTLNYSDCPLLCSVQLNQLVQSLDQLELKIGEDFDLLTLSIDPNETTQKIKQTKDKYIALLPNQPGAAANWHFVTSDQNGIDKVTDALGFRYRYDELTKEYYHPAMLAFVSPGGVITRYSLDVAFPANQMNMAIIEASEGRVGSIVDQFLMLCFRYDAERNRYVASAWKIMRLGGMATVGFILVMVGPFWFGARRHRNAMQQPAPSIDE